MINNRISQKPESAAGLLETHEVLSFATGEVLDRLGTSITGLSSEEVERRLEKYGTNEIARKGKRSAPLEFLLPF